MSLAKDYIGQSKCQAGIGGIKCHCCSPMGCSPRKSKPLMRRIVRRRNKQGFVKEYMG